MLDPGGLQGPPGPRLFSARDVLDYGVVAVSQPQPHESEKAVWPGSQV